jgi:hypothetical protein
MLKRQQQHLPRHCCPASATAISNYCPCHLLLLPLPLHHCWFYFFGMLLAT